MAPRDFRIGPLTVKTMWGPEGDEDDRLIAAQVPDAYAVVAYQIEWMGGIVQFPFTASIVRGRRFTAWQPLPEPPPSDKEPRP